MNPDTNRYFLIASGRGTEKIVVRTKVEGSEIKFQNSERGGRVASKQPRMRLR